MSRRKRTTHGSKVARKGRRIARKRLKGLIKTYNSKYCNCGNDVVRVATINKQYKEVKYERRNGIIRYRNNPNEKFISNRIATVQHLMHPAQPGANLRKNLRLFCYTCNQADCRQKQPKKIRPCKMCGAITTRASCPDCRRYNNLQYLINQSLTSSCL